MKALSCFACSIAICSSHLCGRGSGFTLLRHRVPTVKPRHLDRRCMCPSSDVDVDQHYYLSSTVDQKETAATGWWGRGGLPQKHPSPDIVSGLQQPMDIVEGGGSEKAKTTRKRRTTTRRKARVYKHLFRHYEDISIDCWLRCAEPREFLLSCNWTDDEIDRMAGEFPPLLNLDVHGHLAPKVRFIVETMGGGRGDLTWAADEDLPDGEECDVIDRSPHNLRVSDAAKRSIPPHFFGQRIERTVGPRHAYLSHFGLPHGTELLRNGGRRMQDFLNACAKSPAEFAVLCMRWAADNARTMGGSVTVAGSAVHTSARVEAFEKAFRGGLLAAARNELTAELRVLGCSPGRMVQLLLQHGANHIEPDRHGASLLHWAAGTGNSGGVRVLLEAYSSAYEGMDSPHGEAILNLQGAKDGATPLHWACCGVGPNGFGTGGHVEVCRLFLEMSGERSRELANAKTITSNTPIMWAAWSGSLEVAKLLISHGADPHFRNDNGCNSAHWASSGGHLDMCKYLHKDLGVDFTEKDDAGHTPLNHAIKYGHPEVVEWIVDTFYSDPDGVSPLPHEEELLARYFVDWSPGIDSRRAVLDVLEDASTLNMTQSVYP